MLSDSISGPTKLTVRWEQSTTGEMPFNLVSLREDLSKMSKTTDDSYTELYRRQEELETSAMESARQKFATEAESIARKQSALSKKTIQAWMWEWYSKLLPDLTDQIETLEAQEQEVQARFQANYERRTYLTHTLESVILTVRTNSGEEV